jgi:phosphohistidine phosphatase
VSTAVRARTTAAFFREAWDIAAADVEERADLYLASRTALADAVAAFNDQWDRVMIVGHNPGLTDLVEYFAGGPDRHLPTCSVVVLRFTHARSWAETGRGTGSVETFLYPKALWER